MSDEKTKCQAVSIHQKAVDADHLNLQFIDQTAKKPSAGAALIRVAACAVNPSDVKACLGLMPQAVWPRTPGRDFAGTVVEGPSDWIGKEVYGSGGDVGITKNGSHACFLEVPVQALRLKPKNISMNEAGSVGVPFVTAFEGFRRSGMPQSGQHVLIFGANGKVGQAAVQLAARAGAQVIAVQRGGSHFEGFSCRPIDVIDANAQDVVDRVKEITGGKGVHIVYNTVGSAYFAQANQSMGKGATQIFIATHERAVPFDIFSFYRGMHTYVGIDSLAMDCVSSTAQLDEMRAGFEEGTLKPFPVKKIFSLHEADEAYRLVISGSKDRVVLNP